MSNGPVGSSSAGRPIRTIVTDDSVLLRDGIVRLLTDSGLDVVGAVGDADALLDAVADFHPDLCLVDVRMPPTHTPTKAFAQRSRFVGVGLTSRCWCCRST